MLTLASLGWNDTWAAHFQPHDRAGLLPGRVCAEHKELYGVCSAAGAAHAQVSGRLRYQACGRGDFPAVGDWVALEPAGAGQAVIHAMLPRTNTFSRKAPGEVTEEQVVAANLDTLFLVTSLNRDLNFRRLERYLTASRAHRVKAVLILSKSDLCDDPANLIRRVQTLAPEVPVLALSAYTGAGLDALAPYLGPGLTVAMVGSSGVGKSTLLNALLGKDVLAVAPIREEDDRGRHTTTHRQLVLLPQGGLLIDTPGMRELQLWEADDLDATFADVAALAGLCRFPDCSHVHEPGCAVREAVARGELEEGRLESYHKLGRELAYLDSRRDGAAARERKERERRIHRIYYKQQKRREPR